MHEIMSYNTAQDQYKLKSRYGTRFSVLAFLPYLDTIHMSVIDPMHNLFLGSVKNLSKIWKELGYLNKENLEKIQEKQIVSLYLMTLEKYKGKLLVFFIGSMLTNIKMFCYCFPYIHYMGSFLQETLAAHKNFLLPQHVYAKKLFQKVTLL